MAEQLFRNEVIEAGRNRLTGTVIAAVPPSSRVYTRLLLVAALGLVLILALASYATTAEVRGVVAYDTGVARIYSNAPGEVRAVHVRVGEPVKAGQPIMTLALAQGQGGVAPQLDQFVKQDDELARQLALAANQSKTAIAALDAQSSGIRATIGSLTRQRSIAVEQVSLAQSAVRRAEKLAGEGAGTKRQVEESRSALLARRAEVEGLDEQILAQKSLLRTNAAERDRLALDSQKNQSDLALQRASLAEQKAGLARSDQVVLAAPIDGVVGDIGVEIGQQVRPDRNLASVIPQGSKLEIWLYAPTRAVGTAREGQPVRLQFDAFPFEKYGSGTGVVAEVSRVATDPANVDAGLGITEPVFRIRTTLTGVAARGKLTPASLRPGMTLSAKMQLERRKLWQVLLGPIAETFD
jgi:membrane fusion protein